VCLGLVMQRRWYVGYYLRPAGDENAYDDVIPGFDRWTMPIRQQRNLVKRGAGRKSRPMLLYEFMIR